LIAALLAVPQHAVALGVDGAPGVGVADRVALLAPVRRVRGLELGQPGHDFVVQADQAEHAHHAGRGALAFAVRAPGDEHRHRLGAGRPEHVDVDRHAVAQGHRHVLLEHDVDRDGPERRRDLEAGGQGPGAGLEVAQDAVPVARLQWLRRHVDLLVIAHAAETYAWMGFISTAVEINSEIRLRPHVSSVMLRGSPGSDGRRTTVALIDSRIYIQGRRADQPQDLHEVFDALKQTGGVAWIGLTSPTASELTSVGDEFGLHPLAIEDAQKGHQRSKIDRYGDTLFVVLRPAWYDDNHEQVHFGEIHLFVGPHFVVTVRHGSRPDLSKVRANLESEPDFLSMGSEAALTAFLDEIVDGYAPVVAGLRTDVDEIEDSLFGAGDIDPALSRRIYQLLSQAIQFQRAIGPVPEMLHGLRRGAGKYGTAGEVQARLENVLDHAMRVTERADTIRTLLENSLTVHATLVSLEQNEAMRQMSSASLAQGEESRRLAEETMEQGEEVKKISSWAAILFTPTLVASVYGMNFDHMPELHWHLGYPFAVALMFTLGLCLWGIFKRKRWL
jgi:magnesium transporter